VETSIDLEQLDDFRACLKRRGVGPLLHFTAVGNLARIVRPGATPPLAPGLWSRSRLHQAGIQPVRLHRWGGKGRVLQDFICTGFHLPEGMLRSEAEPPAVLEIDREIVLAKGVCFCPANSASRRISTEEILAYEGLEAFENLFQNPEGKKLKYQQSEVLIPQHIPLAKIRTIFLPATAAGQSVYRRVQRKKWLRRLGGRFDFPRLKWLE
jgi:hypothetical protein